MQIFFWGFRPPKKNLPPPPPKRVFFGGGDLILWFCIPITYNHKDRLTDIFIQEEMDISPPEENSKGRSHKTSLIKAGEL